MKKIEEYVRNQLKEDLEYDQMSLKEYIDPFTVLPLFSGDPVQIQKQSLFGHVFVYEGAAVTVLSSQKTPEISLYSVR